MFIKTSEMIRTTNRPLKSGHILIVDDENNIRLMLRAALATEGYTIEEACNGRLGIEAVARRKPDLMILDLSMPVLDGIGVLESLTDLAPAQRPKVIVLTAYGSIPAAVKATRLGAVDFLEKPVSPAELRDAVDAAIALPLPGSMAEQLESDAVAGGYAAVLNRVRKSLRLANYTDAEALLMKAADLAHRDAAYFNLLGVLYESQRKWNLAKKFYGKAIAFSKDYEPAQKNMRRIYELERFGKSIESVTLGDEPDVWFARMP
jgi:DNA-binding response OmpR family regulator